MKKSLVINFMSLFFRSDMHKFKLEAKLKTLVHIVDEKQVGIKDAIIIISSLNASQKHWVSEVPKLVKLANLNSTRQ